MEKQVVAPTTPATQAAPATKVKPEKRFLLHAVLKTPPTESSSAQTVKVTAEKKRELFAKIAEFPGAEIVTIIKGRELKFQETRQVRLV